MGNTTITIGGTNYFVLNGMVPAQTDLPWDDEECDAFVAVLDGKLLDAVANELSFGLVRLRTDWVEMLGEKAELLHDLVDEASVRAGREKTVGDGNPMTAWHEDLSKMMEMVEYVKLGGLGSSNNKLVIVVGPPHGAEMLADELSRSAQVD